MYYRWWARRVLQVELILLEVVLRHPRHREDRVSHEEKRPIIEISVLIGGWIACVLQVYSRASTAIRRDTTQETVSIWSEWFIRDKRDNTLFTVWSANCVEDSAIHHPIVFPARDATTAIRYMKEKSDTVVSYRFSLAIVTTSARSREIVDASIAERWEWYLIVSMVTCRLVISPSTARMPLSSDQ